MLAACNTSQPGAPEATLLSTKAQALSTPALSSMIPLPAGGPSEDQQLFAVAAGKGIYPISLNRPPPGRSSVVGVASSVTFDGTNFLVTWGERHTQ